MEFSEKKRKNVCVEVLLCVQENFMDFVVVVIFFCSLYTEYFFPFSCTNFVIGLNFRSNIFVLMPRIDFAVLLWRSIFLPFFQNKLLKKNKFFSFLLFFFMSRTHKNL